MIELATENAAGCAPDHAMKTAKALGIAIPQPLLRVDEVIQESSPKALIRTPARNRP